MLALPFTLLALAASSFAADPTPPKLTYLLSVNITFAAPLFVDFVPYGRRDVLTITGGTFAGPKLKGELTRVLYL